MFDCDSGRYSLFLVLLLLLLLVLTLVLGTFLSVLLLPEDRFELSTQTMDTMVDAFVTFL